MEPDANSAHALATIRKVRKDLPHMPFYRQVDFSAMLPEPQEDTMFGFINPFDELVQAKVSRQSIVKTNVLVSLIALM
jgi:hypothetical protein